MSLEHRLATARAAWPGVALDDAATRAFVGEREPVADERMVDVVLASALAHGAAGAIEAFTATYASHLRAIIGRTVSSETLREEAFHTVFTHLFVAEPGAQPRIAAYRGTGDLLAFVRIAAVRVTLSLLRKDKPVDDDSEGELAAMAAIGSDPELIYLKELYRNEFRASFQAAVAALDKRAKTLLRYQLIDGLSIDKVAAIYDVHRATAARQIADARAALVQGTRNELMARLRIESAEMESILRLIESQVDVSVRRLLQK
ncbi:MAG: transcriptional regulator [Kofleriaceae bacterium]|nr:transcriptional regulator [Kofleriaceae bacterium]